jgi:hypothetical protein
MASHLPTAYYGYQPFSARSQLSLGSILSFHSQPSQFLLLRSTTTPRLWKCSHWMSVHHKESKGNWFQLIFVVTQPKVLRRLIIRVNSFCVYLVSGEIITNFQPRFQYILSICGMTFIVCWANMGTIFALFSLIKIILVHTESLGKYFNFECHGQIAIFPKNILLLALGTVKELV